MYVCSDVGVSVCVWEGCTRVVWCCGNVRGIFFSVRALASGVSCNDVCVCVGTGVTGAEDTGSIAFDTDTISSFV